MTEAEWNACTDPQLMLQFLRGTVGARKRSGPWTRHRKFRLFACACCRRVSYLSADIATAIEQIERFADGEAKHKERIAAGRTIAKTAKNVAWPEETAECLMADLRNAATRAMMRICHDSGIGAAAAVGWASGMGKDFDEVKQGERQRQASILRCIFGSLPFRSIAIDRSWLTPTVTNLARATYQEHAFDRLPILADALEDSGCTNQEVLGHLRGGGEHTRGCWVVDLLIGKA
jgi:hypothetical protein